MENWLTPQRRILEASFNSQELAVFSRKKTRRKIASIQNTFQTNIGDMVENNSGVSWSNNFRDVVTIMNQEKTGDSHATSDT